MLRRLATTVSTRRRRLLTAAVEPLEARQLLSAYVQNRVLFVDGTAGNDKEIRVTGVSSFQDAVTINGQGAGTFDSATYDSILLRGFDGGDHMVVSSVNRPATLQGGDGNDDLWAAGSSAALDGGTGNDASFFVDNARVLGITDAGGHDSVAIQNCPSEPLQLNFDMRNYPFLEELHGVTNVTGNDLDNIIDAWDGTIGPAHFTGGAGNDTLIGNGSYNTTTDLGKLDTLDGGAGNDRISNSGGTLIGGTGDDLFQFGTVLFSPTVVGGTGNDTVDFTDYSVDGGIVVSLDDLPNDGVRADASLQTANIHSDVEQVRGSRFADSITGSGAANMLAGKDGNDTINGNGGNDSLYGDNGDDVVNGGSGIDYIGGGAGNDTLTATAGTLQGSSGDDVLVLKANLGSLNVYGGDGGKDIADFTGYTGAGGKGVVVSLDNVANDGDMNSASARHTNVHSDVEQVRGSQFADEISGSDSANVLSGKGGNDTLHGNGGNDSLYGDDGSDLIGGAGGNDYVGGGSGNDSLYGGDGNDTVAGSDGNDYLDGQANADTIDGGNGNDTARKDSLDSRFNVEQVIA